MHEIEKLCRKYLHSDSVSEREDLEIEICERCEAYLKKLYSIAKPRGGTTILGVYFGYGYLPDTGYYELVDVESDGVEIEYGDSWNYGGRCGFTTFIEYDNLVDEDKLFDLIQ